jgi:hypothetical protein
VVNDRKDVTPKYLSQRGVRIVRVEEPGHYPRSGNAHHPSPRYRWETFLAEALLGISYTLRGAKELAETE